MSGQTEIFKKTKQERRVGWHGMRYYADEYYPNYFDPVQLINLDKDPFERVNLADNPEYAPIAQQMRAELLGKVERLKAEQARLGDPVE